MTPYAQATLLVMLIAGIGGCATTNKDSWPSGLYWTRGYWATSEFPEEKANLAPCDEGVYVRAKSLRMHVCSGPFFFTRNFLGAEMYAGFRPTPPWPPGVGNEGFWWWAPAARWLKRHGCGNLGCPSQGKTRNMD